MRSVRWIALAGLLMLATTAMAGTIHPALQAEMDRTAANRPISVIVNMTEQAPIPSMNQDFHNRQVPRIDRHRDIVSALRQTARTSQPSLLSYLDARIQDGGVIGYTSYWIGNLIVVQATAAEIRTIAARADVDVVEPNFTVSLIEPIGIHVPRIMDADGLTDGPRAIGVPPGLRAINAPEVWYQLGYNGAGRLIANLDTGVDGTHPALQTRWRGYQGQHPWQECWLDVLGTNTQSPVDTYGHGTHVMGTMTGLGARHGHGRRISRIQVDRLQRDQPGRGQRLRQRHHHGLPVVRRSRRKPEHGRRRARRASRTPGASTRASAGILPTPTATPAGGP